MYILFLDIKSLDNDKKTFAEHDALNYSKKLKKK